MNLLGLISLFLGLLATRLYFTARNIVPDLAPIIVSLVIIRFLFQRSNLTKTKMRHILQHKFEHRGSYSKKEKRKPNFILKSVFMDDLSQLYREWANPAWYFWAKTSKSGDRDSEDSESNSDEESSYDENEDSVEKETKMDAIEVDDSVACTRSTKEDLECLPASQISQKRKAESEAFERSKRSKSTDSSKTREGSKQTEKLTDISINKSSDTSSYKNEETLSVSELQSTLGLGSSSTGDRIYELPETVIKDLPVEKSKTSRFPPQASLPSRDRKPGIEDVNPSDSNDKSLTLSGKERFSSCDDALKNTVPVCQTKHRETKSARIETSSQCYQNPEKTWKNQLQDKPSNTPSDPRIRRMKSESRWEPARRLHENQSFRADTLAHKKTDPNSNTKTCGVGKHSKSSAYSSQNALKYPLIFPEIHFSSLVIQQSRQRNFAPCSFDVSEEIAEITRKFFEAPPCSSTDENIPDEILKAKSYPGLSLQPQKVKKDARYQKKFYRERKEITLPRKLGDVIQWAAEKTKNEVNIPVPDVLSSDEKDLPVDKYYEKAQVLSHNYMRMFHSLKEQKAVKKLERKTRREQKERMRRQNASYAESSFKEESPSSETSSDSLPTSGEYPVKGPTSSVPRRKIPSDFDISMFEVSPLKPVATVSPRYSCQQENSRLVPPGAVNIRHLSDDENVCEVPPLLDSVGREISTPRVDIYCRDKSGYPVPSRDIGQSTNPCHQERKSPSKPPQGAQTTRDLSDLCRVDPAACAREILFRKRSEEENPSCWTETTLNKYTTVRKFPEAFKSNPISISTLEKSILSAARAYKLDLETSDHDSLTSVSSSTDSLLPESSSNPESSNPESPNSDSQNVEPSEPRPSNPEPSNLELSEISNSETSDTESK